ncbi:tyrosine-type recombinase/integrase [Bradyrhizobium sp. AUGA SZCCT0042]|uniref:tyrosine-type recombinase/integrase n=1 Tax=Bradyrhizobium sp. AUGA SZCCT0042 TaxID=2807651 RepID=UPI001BADA20B|nr:tyrosine-type recombinase/integrase [Bradyrhizobium sp. AUGA SZCCT0042]MBR1301238.1 tyrosine-type recombinase/integrase [Bradyrhizobium sp. AUGA SZCCT0042]
MPLKLRDPRPPKTPNYSVRGTYLGVYVERTAGTPDKKVAAGVLKRIKNSIERGDYATAPEPVEAPRAPTFADAALAYLRAGGEGKFLGRIIEQTGPFALRDRLLAEIDQIAIDSAAAALYPAAPATTTNRQIYTPVSAVLKHAGIERKIRRPKGWRGSKATSWLEPEQAFRLIGEAYQIDYEFGLFCEMLLYTGMRLSDPVRARLRDLKLDQALLYIPDTKNSDPRPVHLTPRLVQAFRKAPPRPVRPRKAAGHILANGEAGRSRRSAGVPFLDRAPNEKLFRFAISGHLRKMLKLALSRAGVSLPRRQAGFHIFCHTYGTWMKRYGRLDTWGLTRTGRWKDPDSADRYNHTEASWEARQADLLPVPHAKRIAR